MPHPEVERLSKFCKQNRDVYEDRIRRAQTLDTRDNVVKTENELDGEAEPVAKLLVRSGMSREAARIAIARNCAGWYEARRDAVNKAILGEPVAKAVAGSEQRSRMFRGLADRMQRSMGPKVSAEEALVRALR